MFRRFFSIALLLIVFLSALPTPAIRAQDESSPTLEAATETATILPTEPSTIEMTQTATVTLTSTPTVAATETNTVVPTTTFAGPISFDPTNTPVAVATATIPATNQAADGTSTGAKVIVHLNDANGPVLANICASLYGRDHHDWNSTDCTNGEGEMFLPVLVPSFGPKQYLIEIENTPGYGMPPGNEFVATLPYGTVDTFNIWAVAQLAGTETLKAIDAVSGTLVGGACWEYQHDDATVIGPVCDADNDGIVTIPDITADSYCLVTTPPPGYNLVGTEPLCAPQQVRNGTYTKLVFNQASGGSLHLIAQTPWGQGQRDVCVQLSASIGGNQTDFSAGCTNASGVLNLDGLLPGSYTLTSTGLPAAFVAWSPIALSINTGTTTDQTISLVTNPNGNINITSVLYYGPETLSGACYSYTTNDQGKPGPYTVIGPVCDTDNDGVTVLTGVPMGPFCFALVSPPPGYYRQSPDAFYCDDQMRGGTTSVGFSPIPSPTATATNAGTATKTKTPRPTSTPWPTATTIPSPPPAGNEPNAGLVIQNCHYTDPASNPQFFLCESGGAGVRLQVIQGGQVVQTITTGASGVATVTLPNRKPYTLHYLDGNTTWASGDNEETRSRYTGTDTFYFQPGPSVNRAWHLTVSVNNTVWPQGDWTGTSQPLGGACARIDGNDNQTYIAERCDTDNNGIIDFGTLPPRIDPRYGFSFYKAVMTQAPAGFPLRIDNSFGSPSAADPFTWAASWTYGTHEIQIRAEDPEGNLVGGYCYKVSIADGNTILNYNYNRDYQGILNFGTLSFLPGTQVTITPQCQVAGYAIDTTPQVTTVPTGYRSVVTFVTHKYGSEGANQASVRIVATSFKYQNSVNIVLASFDDSNTSALCLRLTPNSGNPANGTCVDGPKTREAVFRNLDPGTYSITEALNTSGCTLHSSGASFTITNADLGKEKLVRYVMDCNNDRLNCTAFRTGLPGRAVNVYYGTLYDEHNNPVATKLFMSESIASDLYDQLIQSALPDNAIVNASALQAWAIPFAGQTSATPWSMQPDYDNNAQQLLTNIWNGYANAVVDAPVDRGTIQAESIGAIGVYFGPLDEQIKTEWPECADLAPSGIAFLYTSYASPVHFYRLDARIVPPTATATATTTATASPTPIPSPAAVCTTNVLRNVEAFYGVLRDEDGKTISSNLALSDHIPAALSDAIRHADSPGKVKNLISHWIDTALVEQDWGTAPGGGLDPATELQSQYGGQTIRFVLGDTTDLGTETYAFTTYVLYDSASVPAGCILPADFAAAGLGTLIPVEQTTTVTVHYMGQDATAQGQVLPTATATPQPTGTDTATPTSIPTEPTGASVTPTQSPENTEVPATAVPTRSGAQESPTTAVTTLPNTGAHPSRTGTDRWWLMVVLLILAAGSLGVTIRRLSTPDLPRQK